MDNRDLNCYKGLTRTDYLQDRALLDNFEPLESDWKELFHWVIYKDEKVCNYDNDGERVNGITDLWKDHIFTILIDIIQTRIEKAQDEFVRNINMPDKESAAQDLRAIIKAWIDSIERYLNMELMSGENPYKNSAVLVAQFIARRLNEFLPIESKEAHDITPEERCRMMNAIVDIKNKSTFYLQQIEDSGSMDPGLALLLVFIRNYSTIVKQFNQNFSILPEWYHSKILMATPRKAIQNKASLIIVPSDPINGFYLPKGTLFIAEKKEDGTELLYETEKEEFISGIQVGRVFTIFQEVKKIQELNKKAFYKQNIDIHGTSPSFLFDKAKSSDYAYGWMIESNLFLISEGEAEVKISFSLNHKQEDKKINVLDLANSFEVYVSDTKGWSRKSHKIEYEEKDKLIFTIERHKINDTWIKACEEKHKLVSENPIVRILANNENCPYDWAVLIEFNAVQVDVDVEHVHSVNVYNEQGEIDATKPFYPFGTIAERGAWFRFGSEEIARKKLDKVKITGIWNRLPPLEDFYKNIYESWNLNKDDSTDIPIVNNSFKIKSERMVNGQWVDLSKKATEKNTLFCIEKDGKLQSNALIELDPSRDCLFTGTVVNDSKPETDCPFRITLIAPDIGFGTEKFRQIFAERMIAQTKQELSNWKLPTMPIIPVWEDLELSYKASDKIDLLNHKEAGSSIRISRVTDLAEYVFNPITELGKQSFVLKSDNEHVLYLSILNVSWERTIRMYFDMSFLKIQMFQEESHHRDMPSTMEWHYMNGGNWELLEAKYVLMDGTCGFTQSGYIELRLPDRISRDTEKGIPVFWLKGYIVGDVTNCLAIRSIYTDYIPVVARDGDGSSIPAKTIKQLKDENPYVKALSQPLPGYGGMVMDSSARSSVHQRSRIASRNRALTSSDYEQLILERFSDIGKVCCISSREQTVDPNNQISNVNIVVFTHTEDNEYPITPVWKLAKIKEYISRLTSPLADINIVNPIYQAVKIECVATVRREAIKNSDTMKRMIANIWEYYASWKQSGTFPELGRHYSYKALHTILANDKDVVKVFELKINGKSLMNVDVETKDLCLDGNTPWSVLVPGEINLELLLLNGGIEHLKIEYNFVIQ